MTHAMLKAKTKGLGRTSQENPVETIGTLEGGLVRADLAYLLSLNGDIYVANGALASSAATFMGAYDADGPDFVIDVPDGTTIVPLKVDVYYETVGTTLLMEVFGSISNSLAGTCTVTGGAAITPVNIRTGDSGTSSCTVSASVDAAGCAVQSGNIYEFFRHGFQLAEEMAAAEPGWPEKQYTWSAAEEGIYPIIDGEGSLYIHACSQAGTGFISVIYYEVDTTSI